MLSVNHISQSFNNKIVLDDVNFSIQGGEAVSIYGDSGSGKSTIARIICGLQKPNMGNVYLDNKALWEKRYNRSLGKRIQMVYQEPIISLDPSLKIKTQINELLRYYKKNKDISALLKTLNIREELLSHYPYQISGGEAQRINLLRALLMEPEILILDEATSMCDTINQKFIMDYCFKVFLNEKTAILNISHNSALVKEYTHRLYILEGTHLYEQDKEKF